MRAPLAEGIRLSFVADQDHSHTGCDNSAWLALLELNYGKHRDGPSSLVEWSTPSWCR